MLDLFGSTVHVVFMALAIGITFGAVLLALNRNPLISLLSLPVSFIASVILGGLYPGESSSLIVAWPMALAALGMALINTLSFQAVIPPKLISTPTAGGSVLNASSVAPAAAAGPANSAAGSRHWASA